MPASRRTPDWFSNNLIEVLPTAVYVCDLDAVVVAFNEHAVKLWGRTPDLGAVEPERFCGAHRLFLPDGTVLAHADSPIVAVLRTGEAAVDQEVVLERPDGSRVTVLANIKPLFDRDGTQVGAVNCLQDISVRKQAEQERAELHEDLRQSQKLKAMGELMGGVAHDFNNLLTPILGNLDMLRRREPRDAREARQIDGAMQSAERARTLVGRLLAFARRQPLQSAAVDVAALATGIAELLASTMGPQVRLSFDLQPGMPSAKADPNQLELAILNLAVNARDAMPGGGALTITAAGETVGAGHPAKLRPGRYIRLTVADTGAGMDADTLKRATEPFFSTKGVGQGTGLGLSMVEGLVSQLGGALRLVSRPGLGTSVALFLPVTTEATAGTSAAPAAGPDRLPAGRLLLVDDERLVRAITADMLADLGYEVIEADSAELALRHLGQDQHFDGIITDHLMPGMTGAGLASAVRGGGLGIPVLIVSGYADVEGIASDQPLLSKPFLQADLAASLSALLR